jgi:hypothetical protein
LLQAAGGSHFVTSIRSHDYCGNARTRHLRRLSRRKPAAAWGTHASRMHIMRSMQLACAQASPNLLAKAVLCLEPRASIGTRAYHPTEHAGAKEYGCTHSKWTSVHDLRQHEVAWARPVRVVRLAPMRSLDLRGRVRSLGVNLSLWFTAAQLMYLRGYHLRQRHSNCTDSWKARFWSIAVAAVQSAERGLGGDGVRRGKRRGEESL